MAAEHTVDMELLQSSPEFTGCSRWGAVWTRARAREELLCELAIQRHNRGRQAVARYEQWSAGWEVRRARAWWSRWAVQRWGKGDGELSGDEPWEMRCREGVALTEWGLTVGEGKLHLQGARFLAGAQAGVASGRWEAGTWQLALVGDLIWRRQIRGREGDRPGEEDAQAAVTEHAAQGAQEAEDRQRWAEEEAEGKARQLQLQQEKQQKQWQEAEDRRRQVQQGRRQKQLLQRQEQRKAQRQWPEEERELRRRAGRGRRARAATAEARSTVAEAGKVPRAGKTGGHVTGSGRWAEDSLRAARSTGTRVSVSAGACNRTRAGTPGTATDTGGQAVGAAAEGRAVEATEMAAAAVEVAAAAISRAVARAGSRRGG